MMKRFIFSLSVLMVSLALYPGGISLKLKKITEVGSDDPILSRIYNISEDISGNFYLIDRKAYKVRKFSPDGKLLLSFGQKGEGPGDLKSPHRVFISEKDEIIVTDISNTISYFDNSGKFLKRYNVGKLGYLLVFRYAGNNKFFAQKYNAMTATLVLINLKPEFINKEIFRSFEHKAFKGKNVVIVLNDKEFTPQIYTSSYGKYSISAKGDEYKIYVFNSEGKIINTILKNIERPELSSKEKARFINEINKVKSYSPRVKKGIIGTIPDKKNLIGGLAISDKYIFVERIKDDVSDMEAPFPVDIYYLKGKKLGELKMKHFPVLITDDHIYTKEKDEDENLIAVKYLYKLSIKH